MDASRPFGPAPKTSNRLRVRQSMTQQPSRPQKVGWLQMALSSVKSLFASQTPFFKDMSMQGSFAAQHRPHESPQRSITEPLQEQPREIPYEEENDPIPVALEHSSTPLQNVSRSLPSASFMDVMYNGKLLSTMDDSELCTHLRRRGLSTDGSREDLLKRLRKRACLDLLNGEDEQSAAMVPETSEPSHRQGSIVDLTTKLTNEIRRSQEELSQVASILSQGGWSSKGHIADALGIEPSNPQKSTERMTFSRLLKGGYLPAIQQTIHKQKETEKDQVFIGKVTPVMPKSPEPLKVPDDSPKVEPEVVKKSASPVKKPFTFTIPASFNSSEMKKKPVEIVIEEECPVCEMGIDDVDHSECQEVDDSAPPAPTHANEKSQFSSSEERDSKMKSTFSGFKASNEPLTPFLSFNTDMEKKSDVSSSDKIEKNSFFNGNVGSTEELPSSFQFSEDSGAQKPIVFDFTVGKDAQNIFEKNTEKKSSPLGSFQVDGSNAPNEKVQPAEEEESDKESDECNEQQHIPSFKLGNNEKNPFSFGNKVETPRSFLQPISQSSEEEKESSTGISKSAFLFNAEPLETPKKQKETTFSQPTDNSFGSFKSQSVPSFNFHSSTPEQNSALPTFPLGLSTQPGQHSTTFGPTPNTVPAFNSTAPLLNPTPLGTQSSTSVPFGGTKRDAPSSGFDAFNPVGSNSTPNSFGSSDPFNQAEKRNKQEDGSVAGFSNTMDQSSSFNMMPGAFNASQAHPFTTSQGAFIQPTQPTPAFGPSGMMGGAEMTPNAPGAAFQMNVSGFNIGSQNDKGRKILRGKRRR